MIGSSPQLLLEGLVERCPGLPLKVWGMGWVSRSEVLAPASQGRGVLGLEYTKALSASKVNLGILSERRPGASSGDQITSRTFHIPATGSFMLHERTDEFLEYFKEGTECACFADADELAEKVAYYLNDSGE